MADEAADGGARLYLTSAFAPVEARVRERAEDFVVEEIPSYLPSGEGSHLYLWIEKQGIPTPEAIFRLARALGTRADLAGYAGLKDAHAVSRQWISFEHKGPLGDLGALAAANVRVLEASRHTNKLRPGHLRGNRFAIRLSGAARARATLEGALAQLAREGLPNLFGAQRFGSVRKSSAALGWALVRDDAERFLDALLGQPDPRENPRILEARSAFARGDHAEALAAWPPRFSAERRALTALVRGRKPKDAARATPKGLRKLYVSAAQSETFNALCRQRLAEGRLGTLEDGDVAHVHASGAAFLVEDAAREQPRADALEISPAGPLFGSRLLRADGAVRAREEAEFARHGLGPDGPFGGALAPAPPGARRPYRVPLAEAALEEDPGGARSDLWVRFALPAGSYATSVLEELLKREVA